jgi:DNA-directed RNA polymerase subunit RPC12/RpoP
MKLKVKTALFADDEQVMTKQGLLDMIFIVCTRCGQHIEMDENILPYKGEVACPNCRNVMKVFLCTGHKGQLEIQADMIRIISPIK